MIGRALLHYKIIGKLGEGGMGEVYRATDEKLGRDVAIKVLPEAFAADAERLARFEREARLLAGLNHPNIAAIHGIEAVENQRFLVLELVEGEDLAERLKRGPLSLDKALDMARQVATALEVAHEQGVVHRDLKPANVLVNKDGIVKVLDFGLAKAHDAAGDQSSPQLTHSPTVLHSSPTMAGVILGTAAYMSPEQARGKTVDKRADIFAFGALLFEMLTGTIAFDGETVSDTLAAVLKEEPDYDSLPANTPPALRTLMTRCIEKDVKQRLRDIGEARIALDHIASGTADAHGAVIHATTRPSAARRVLPWAITGIAALVAAWSLVQRSTPAPAPTTAVTSHILAPDGVEFDLTRPGISFSPDGSKLAFIGVDTDGIKRLYVREFATGQDRVIDRSEGARTPFWSPDGRHVAFNTGAHLKRVDLATGNVRIIAEINGADGSWNEDDVIVFNQYAGSQFFKVSASGGIPEPLGAANPDAIIEQEFPQFLPDNRSYLFSRLGTSATADDGVCIGSLDLEEPVQLIMGLTNARYSAGHILCMQDDRLVARSFNPDTRELGDVVHQIAAPVQTMSFPYCGFFSSADNGALAYVEGVESAGFTELVWVDRAGQELERTGIVGDLYNQRLSGDERYIALDISTPETAGDIWVYDQARRSSRSLSKHVINESMPTWSADDSELYFFRGPALYRVPVTGGEPELLFAGESKPLRPSDVSPDGRLLLCELRLDPIREIAVWDIQAGSATQHTSIDAHTEWLEFAPDGNWISYNSNESGRQEVYVERFPDRGERFLVSRDGGMMARWRGDSRELFYLTLAGDMMSVPVDMNATASAPIGEPTFMFSTRLRDGDYDVTADGQRFLLNQRLDPESTRSLVFIQNWPGRIADTDDE